ncbi:MAG TPA: hypothetical protein VFQ75_07215 [Candidatus Limnocylindrales bacterium]|nr:hypothetical protein [Candidatus Limnocylindrales bacterium]
MSGELRGRVVRRTIVVAMTGAVLVAGVFTVGLAAQWRADSAPLDVAPVGMSQLDADLAAEVTRSSDLTSQIADVAGQVATLRGALLTAGDTVTSDTGSAQALQAKLDTATAKLAKLQGQLKAAQRRLAALNDAAARQAALNRAAGQGSSTSTSSGSSGGGGEHESDDD